MPEATQIEKVRPSASQFVLLRPPLPPAKASCEYQPMHWILITLDGAKIDTAPESLHRTRGLSTHNQRAALAIYVARYAIPKNQMVVSPEGLHVPIDLNLRAC